MFQITLSVTFVKHFKILPRVIQVKTDDLVSLLAIDFRDTRLHSKKLRLEDDIYSFKVGRDYRVLFMFMSGAEIKLLDIRHRKDIY